MVLSVVNYYGSSIVTAPSPAPSYVVAVFLASFVSLAAGYAAGSYYSDACCAHACCAHLEPVAPKSSLEAAEDVT